MPKEKKNFKCTDAKTCIFRFRSDSAIEGPEQNSNLTIVPSKDHKELLITVKDNANFTLFSASPITYVLAEKSGIQDITVKTTPPISKIQAAEVNVNSGKGAHLAKPAVNHVEDDVKDEDDEAVAVFEDEDDVGQARTQSPQCMAVKKYKYNNNSCWMDSVLFALFAFPTDFVRHYILDRNVQDIRGELKSKIIEGKHVYTDEQLSVIIPYIGKIQQILRNISRNGNNQRLNSIGPDDISIDPRNPSSVSYHLESLRNVLRKSYKEGLFAQMNAKREYKEMDVEEFVSTLFDVFNINNITKNETQTYSSTLRKGIEPYPSPKTDTQPPIYKIEQTILDELSRPTKIFNLSRGFHTVLDKDNYAKGNQSEPVFNIRDTIDNFQIVPSTNNNFMILQIPRFDYDLINAEPVKITQKIFPPLQVKINDENPELKLNQIIVHIGKDIISGHYVTYFKCNHNWYLYNDTEGISFVGTHKQLLDHDNKTVLKNAYLLFYSNANTQI
jgi:hypothetical protein